MDNFYQGQLLLDGLRVKINDKEVVRLVPVRPVPASLVSALMTKGNLKQEKLLNLSVELDTIVYLNIKKRKRIL